MNALNSLRAEAICPACGTHSIFEVLFRYGKSQPEPYRIGDSIECLSMDADGGSHKIAAEALSWPCGSCHRNFLEFDVLIEGGVIKGLKPLKEGRNSHSDEGFQVV